MTSPVLAGLLVEGGRHTFGPLVVDYLAKLHDLGELSAAVPAASLTLRYGPVIEDIQFRGLLGQPALVPEAIRAQQAHAVTRFF